VDAQFHPFLKAYVTEQYQHTELIEGEIISKLLWKENLEHLPDNTEWTLAETTPKNYTFTYVLFLCSISTWWFIDCTVDIVVRDDSGCINLDDCGETFQVVH